MRLTLGLVAALSAAGAVPGLRVNRKRDEAGVNKQTRQKAQEPEGLLGK